MAQTRRIGILTGGGDVPGLNAVIKNVVYRAADMGYEVFGIRRGWEGLTHLQRTSGSDFDPNYIWKLNRENTRTVDRTGGTFLHTSRTNPPKMKKSGVPKIIPADKLNAMQVKEGVYDLTPWVLDNIAYLGLDYLIPIGGDDTLSFARRIEDGGCKVIGVPKTMDNDVQGTEYCIGFSTTVTRAKDIINNLRTTMGSHERIGILRLFGRDAGFTALYAAYVTGGRCVIPEAEFDLDKLIGMLVQDKKDNPSRYSFVVASEGAAWKGYSISEYGEADAFGHKKKANIAEGLGAELRKKTGEETVINDLTYELRGGEPDALDQIVSITFGNIAADLIRDGVHGRLVAVQEGKYTHAPLPDPKQGPRSVEIAKMYDLENYRPLYSGKIGTPMMLLSLPGA